MLKPNEGNIERAGRVVLGIVLIGVALTILVGTAWQWVGFVVGAVLIVTGASGICPLYTVIGMLTKQKDICPTCSDEEVDAYTRRSSM